VSKAGNHTFLWTLLPQKPKIGRIVQRAGQVVRVSNPDMGVNLDPTDKVFFFADSGSPGGPNW